ncbi:MAG: preprotein translocase subunit SecE [Parvularculaceae bacterium]|nr:preprotein translocase subunit SecE [Parvularculaceae bacterium]
MIEGEAEEQKKKKRVGPFDFLKQVRAEAEKVTWTTWNETWVSTMMVLVMVVIMAIFFLIVDQGVRFGVCNVLPIECASRN